jgi:hypothetical protein
MHPALPPKRLTALWQVFLRPDAKRSQAQTKAILSTASFGDSGAMARPRKEHSPTASEQLEVLLGYPWPFPGRPPKHDLSTWTVTDEWPEHIPVTEAEMDVFEAWFGDLFDELFGPCR